MTLSTTPAVLVLEDGRTFRGSAYGAIGETLGEAVFVTAMSGYQETLTDPSYHRQIVIQTAPHIGNTGITDDDDESAKIWVAGYVVRDASRVSSNWRSIGDLSTRLEESGIVGISDVDTRALTLHLREAGAMRMGIFSGPAADADEKELLAKVQASPHMAGAKLAEEVS
ncbi:MAG: carbamoyl-phosphate synthase domain-containing protein, partial [Brevibacterium aurantiacum]